MRKSKKFFMPIIVLVMLMVSICGVAFTNSGVAKAETVTFKTPNCTVEQNSYAGIKTAQDLATENSTTLSKAISDYQKQVGNEPSKNGVIVSPYWSLDINGSPITVYATRTAFGIHSFVYLDVEKQAENFALNVTLTGTSSTSVFDKKTLIVDVLPLSANIAVESDKANKTVKAVIEEFGSYSFTFNESHIEPLTIFVAEKQNTAEIFGTKEIVYIDPGDYSLPTTYQAMQFSEENKVYYFRAGRYVIDQIKLCSNSVFYFEKGFYAEVYPVNNVSNITNWMYGRNVENVVLTGRPLFDMSICCGSELTTTTKPSEYADYPYAWKNNKGGISFTHASNIKVEGLNAINSQTWTCCFTDSDNIHVRNVMFFAFRVFADGVMLANCQDGLVEDSFIRSGDDAFETKSTSMNGESTNNVLFRNNAAWTDKALAYGCVYESSYDQTNVRFENCSVGFALGSWSQHLGSCVIQLGEQHKDPRKTHNITFDNIEIYKSNNQAFINCYIGGTGGRGDGQGTIENIYFKNISCKINKGAAAVNLQTYDSKDCFINEIYLENIYNEGEKLTAANFSEHFIDNVVGGYDLTKLRIDGEIPQTSQQPSNDSNKPLGCFGGVETLLPIGVVALVMGVAMLIVKARKDA